MINLRGTTDTIELVTSAAVALDVVASWVDYVDGATSASPNTTPTAITTATTTTIVAAGGSSTTTRNVKEISIRNKSASSQVDVTVQLDRSSTNYEILKVTLKGGETLHYVEGVGWFITEARVETTCLLKILTADAAGTNGTAAQPWFPANGAVSVEGNTTYRIAGLLALTRSAGTTSHTTSLLFGGTATLTSIQYKASVKSGDVETNAAENATMIRVATATVVKSASTSATETVTVEVDGIVRVNVAGTLIPQFSYSSAPGGAPTVKANSYFKLDKVGDANFAAQGVWA